MRIITVMVLFDTPGRHKLLALKLGPSEIARRLGKNSDGKPVNQSLVSRWLSGHSRPDGIYRTLLKDVCGAEEADWFTPQEQADIECRTKALPDGKDGAAA